MRAPNWRRTAIGCAALVVCGCSAKERLFPSRAPYGALLDRLRTSGGDPARVLRPASAADLDRLEPGKRYKFVVTEDGALVVAPQPADPPNEYTHPILGGGRPVRTAGNLRVLRVKERLTIELDQDSKSYCPTAASLSAAADALSTLGIPIGAIRFEDRRPQCLAPGDTGAPGMTGPADAGVTNR